jgi:thiamine-monophosphate kinase
MGEFDLINRYFRRTPTRSPLGVGDDCALLAPKPGHHLAVSSDMLVEGRHFLKTVKPQHLGHKALAVNLSDLAACGAAPLAFTLALSLPSADETWLAGFAHGMWALADRHGCELVGGDTTKGPLNICITIFGEVPAGTALLRSGARPGDDLWVSGSLGDARLALEALQGRLALQPQTLAATRQRLETPTPRVALGNALRGIATSAIDLSDGLLGDLQHVLSDSQVGATIDTARVLPLLAAGLEACSPEMALTCVLAGGDDYELAFTAPADQRGRVEAAGRLSDTAVTRIGRIETETGLRLLDADGAPLAQGFASYDHFS